MSSKHPVTTTDTVTFGAGRNSPEATSDYSGSGEPTLVQWKRRPYEAHAYPQCSSGDGSGGGGVTNPRSFAAIDLPPPHSPTKPLDHVDFDAKTSATYQSLSDLPRIAAAPQYTSMGCKGQEERRTAPACTKCSVIVGILAVLALLVACGAVGIALHTRLSHQGGPEGDSDSSSGRVSELEAQLTTSKAAVERLSTMVEELQRNLTRSVETRDSELGELSLQVSRINRSVAEIMAPTDTPTTTSGPVVLPTVNLTQNCEFDLVQKCRILDTDVTPVNGAAAGSYPNYSSCFTMGTTITMSDTFIQDVYCAVTNLREERNPVMAILRHDEESDTLSCYCFITALETRLSVVDCSMFVRRCPSVVQVN